MAFRDQDVINQRSAHSTIRKKRGHKRTRNVKTTERP